MKKIDKIRSIDEDKSIMLNGISPVNINIAFRKSSPDAKRISWKRGLIPNINAKKMKAAIMSIAPSILTNTILM